MDMSIAKARSAVGFLIVLCAGMTATHANAASCTTQSQMAPADRDELASTARTLLVQIQTNNTQVLRNNVIPSLAANFDGIVSSVSHLQPLVQPAAITVDQLYLLDDSDNSGGAASTGATPVDFFCGSPVVALSFPALPAGMYALAMVHATGVPHPQQISLILSKSPDGRWLLAGLFVKPMTEGGHDGLWYWTTARRYAQTKLGWNAWFYYRIATNLLDPLDFLSSPNLEKLQREADQIRPTDLPGKTAMTFYKELLTRIHRSAGQKAGYKQLVRELSLGGGRERRLLLEQLARLTVRGSLVKLDREHWSIPKPLGAGGTRDNLAAGRLDMHRDGYGFVRPNAKPGPHPFQHGNLDYAVSYTGEDQVDGKDCYRLAGAKNRKLAYSLVTLSVEKSTRLPIKKAFFAVSEKVLKYYTVPPGRDDGRPRWQAGGDDLRGRAEARELQQPAHLRHHPPFLGPRAVLHPRVPGVRQAVSLGLLLGRRSVKYSALLLAAMVLAAAPLFAEGGTGFALSGDLDARPSITTGTAPQCSHPFRK